MRNVRTFVVAPSLPAPLEPLRELALNLWWAWNPAATDLFRRLDVELWERVGRNPVALLARIAQPRLELAARDAAYLSQLRRVCEAARQYREAPTWFESQFGSLSERVIAYFSAEFGLHESLAVYSGGLGILAGDHLKSASDLGVPLVAVGLAYRHGYFVQQVAEDGWQMDHYPANDFHEWPATLVRDAAGQTLRIEVPLGPDVLSARVFRIDVGRVRLFLLDADIPENRPEQRRVTGRLYDSDPDVRIRQEILLGIGGLRALLAMGIEPTVCHMNEGHSAFLSLERMRHLVHKHGLSFREAREAVFSGGVFTTHTPVPAGIDAFDMRLVERYLGPLAADLGVPIHELLALGTDRSDHGARFIMPMLALRTAYCTNAVSKLHAEVARAMWQSCWPDVPRDEVPITHVTNGVHCATWVSPPVGELYEHYLGPGWATEPHNADVWSRVDEIPDAELWRTHERRRERLIAVARKRLREQLKRRGAPPADVQSAAELLDPQTLTIGFARRFAPYKRATLVFRDLERLASIVNHASRPVQFIFAGKAHPNDNAGKELLKQVIAVCRQPQFRRRIVFLENYDMELAREMVHGVDVWLNNPLRMHEASGTSGMKAVANGVLHLSCLDGWWPEAYDGENGWVVGDGRSYEDPAFQDYVDSQSIYNLLEREIVPMFYERGEDNLPSRWIARMKHSIKTLCPVFNTHRMLREYCERMYRPAMERYLHVAADNFAHLRAYTAWKARLAENWHQVRITSVTPVMNGELRVGDSFSVTAVVQLGPIDPSEVSVEVYYGRVDPSGEIADGHRLPMQHNGRQDDGHVYQAQVPCGTSGQNGFAIRVVPSPGGKPDPREPGMVAWG